MSYSDFSLTTVQTDFGIQVDTTQNLFTSIEPIPVGSGLQESLDTYGPLALAINTEKARSEWLIAPVLGELWRLSKRRISVFSGAFFDVDAAIGLAGYCDFLVCRSSQLYYITAPALMVVEAKKEDIPGGLGQCAAAMVGAQRFNQ